MTSALLRASQPGTLPLSYVAGAKIGTNFQGYAPWRRMFSTLVDIAYLFDKLWNITKIFVKMEHISVFVRPLNGHFVDSAGNCHFLCLSRPEENICWNFTRQDIVGDEMAGYTNTSNTIYTIPNNQVANKWWGEAVWWCEVLRQIQNLALSTLLLPLIGVSYCVFAPKVQFACITIS